MADAGSGWTAREQEALAKGLFLFGKDFNSIACLFDSKKVRSIDGRWSSTTLPWRLRRLRCSLCFRAALGTLSPNG
jgi:hypothetical protein